MCVNCQNISFTAKNKKINSILTVKVSNFHIILSWPSQNCRIFLFSNIFQLSKQSQAIWTQGFLLCLYCRREKDDAENLYSGRRKQYASPGLAVFFKPGKICENFNSQWAAGIVFENDDEFQVDRIPHRDTKKYGKTP